jgi:hypothetical protein
MNADLDTKNAVERGNCQDVPLMLSQRDKAPSTVPTNEVRADLFDEAA